MSKEKQIINQTLEKKYEYEFTTDIEQETIAPGLDENVIKTISEKKNEPKWLLDWRLKSLKHWFKNEDNEPEWANIKFPKIDFQDIRYYSSPTNKPNPKSLVWFRGDVTSEVTSQRAVLSFSLHLRKGSLILLSSFGAQSQKPI